MSATDEPVADTAGRGFRGRRCGPVHEGVRNSQDRLTPLSVGRSHKMVGPTLLSGSDMRDKNVPPTNRWPLLTRYRPPDGRRVGAGAEHLLLPSSHNAHQSLHDGPIASKYNAPKIFSCQRAPAFSSIKEIAGTKTVGAIHELPLQGPHIVWANRNVCHPNAR